MGKSIVARCKHSFSFCCIRLAFKWKFPKNLSIIPPGASPSVQGSCRMELSSYRDQHFKGTRADQERLLRQSTTLYIGNLSYYTTEEQLHELFSKCGDVKRVIMGLDKFKRTPCGFCFVEYYTRQDCEAGMAYINGTRLDDRIIRTDFDAGRGGYGMIMKQRLEIPDFIK